MDGEEGKARTRKRAGGRRRGEKERGQRAEKEKRVTGKEGAHERNNACEESTGAQAEAQNVRLFDNNVHPLLDMICDARCNSDVARRCSDATPISSTQEKLDSLLAALRSHFPVATVQSALSEAGIPAGVSKLNSARCSASRVQTPERGTCSKSTREMPRTPKVQEVTTPQVVTASPREAVGRVAKEAKSSEPRSSVKGTGIHTGHAPATRDAAKSGKAGVKG
eukprot:6211348-Pleurochrysis_carterae.AAC.1